MLCNKDTILRSIKPYFLYLIITGKKTVEIGKNVPKSSKWNYRVYLYCSKDMKSFRRIPKEDRAWMRLYLGKVSLLFNCLVITEYKWPYDKKLCREGCLSLDELEAYGKRKTLFAWDIGAPVAFEPPYELKKFKVENKCYNDTINYDCSEDCQEYELGECDGKYIPITRPPQSWMNVKERL